MCMCTFLVVFLFYTLEDQAQVYRSFRGIASLTPMFTPPPFVPSLIFFFLHYPIHRLPLNAP